MTTRRGWRSGLDSALLVSTLVVCGGGLALLAQSGLAMPGCENHVGTRGSHQWTAVASEADAPDSSDDDGDDADGMGALPVLSTSLTIDNGHALLLTRTHHDPFLSLMSDGHPFRGPPRAGLPGPASAPAWTSGRPDGDRGNPSGEERDCDCAADGDDNDDDDSGALPGDLTRQATQPERSSILICSKFNTWSFASDGNSLRAPPRSLSRAVCLSL